MKQEASGIDEELARERTELANERTAMAQERTLMAWERTELANTQTFLAFLRTAIAFLAAGVGMFEFVSNETIVKLGIFIMALAPVIACWGVVRYLRERRRLKETLIEE